MHDTLFHRKALLVVTTSDAEDVALEFIADTIAWYFLAHAAVHEDTQFAFLFNFDQFLGPVGRVRDVELHLALVEVG